MKQSTLNFAAAKRTISNVGVGKRKIANSESSVPYKPKAVVKSSKELSSKKRDVSDEESDYDDIMLKENNEESVRMTTLEEQRKSGDEDALTRDPQWTRSEERADSATTTRKRSARVQDSRRLIPFKESNLKLEALENKVNTNEIDQLPELDPSSKKWNKQYVAARVKQGGSTKQGAGNKVHEILRVFDNSSEYGPCVGMTRLERWERAHSLGLNPPKEIYEVLMTKQGQTSDEYKESVFYGEV